MARNSSLASTFGELRSDYNAAQSSRFRKQLTGISTLGSGADFHFRRETDFLRVLELARYYDRNDMVVGQAIERLVSNVVQDGITVIPQTGSDDANKYLAEKWWNWGCDADACDAAGEMTFTQITKIALRSVIVDGDVFFLPLSSGRLQAVEAHRCRTPMNTRLNVVNGVLLDSLRRRLEYWFTRDDIDPNRQITLVSEIRKYAARDRDGERQVLHVYHPKRFSQTRGVTAFARIVDPVGMHDDIQFAKMVQQQIVSCFAIFRNRDINFDGPADRAATGEATSEIMPDGTVRRIEGLAPGMEIVGAPGESLQGFSPGVPNESFFQHTKLILTFIAINLNLPLAVLMLDPSETNFSGWRGAIDQARQGWRELQYDVLIDRLVRRVYLWKVRQWLDPDHAEFDAQLAAYAGTANLLRHECRPPSWPYIEPNKDAAGDATIITERLDSRRGVLARRGVDADDVDEQIVADNSAFIVRCLTAAETINDQFKEAGITWRDVAFVTPPSAPKVAEKEGSEEKSGERDAGSGPAS